MRRVALILLLATTAVSAGCLGGSTRSGLHVSPPPTRIEITYFGALHRMCPTGDPCGVSSLEATPCPPGARCVSPAPHAELVRCPKGGRPGLHCYAVPPLRGERLSHDAWVIVQQRELQCSPARGGYADPAAACRALTDYLRLSRTANGAACSCPPELWPDAATGTIRGRRVTLDLSACATCGLGPAAFTDRDALTPALGS
jgi:hypothetical protein